MVFQIVAGINTAYYLSIVAIIIAIILVIVAFSMFIKGSNGWGIGLLITGGIFGLVGGIVYSYTRNGLSGFLPGKLGRGEEYYFDEDPIQNVSGGDPDEITTSSCGCTGGDSVNVEGGDIDNNINELDYLESSDEEDENPIDENDTYDQEDDQEDDDKKENEKKKKKPFIKSNKSHKKNKKGGEDDIFDSLMKLSKMLLDEEDMKDIDFDNITEYSNEELTELVGKILNKADKMKEKMNTLNEQEKNEVEESLKNIFIEGELSGKIDELKSKLSDS